MRAFTFAAITSFADWGFGLWLLALNCMFFAPECPGGTFFVSHPPVRQKRTLPAGRKERRGVCRRTEWQARQVTNPHLVWRAVGARPEGPARSRAQGTTRPEGSGSKARVSA